MLPGESRFHPHLLVANLSWSHDQINTIPPNYQSFQTSGFFLIPVIYTKEKAMDVWKFIFFLQPIDGIIFMIVSNAQAPNHTKKHERNSTYTHRMNREVRW